MKILIATNNPNKYKEYKSIFEFYAPDIKPLALDDVDIKDDFEESADNLLDNAIGKAEFFGKRSGLLTVADDTGLFVDVLNGDPGIYSKRWCVGNDYDRCIKLLERLKDIPEKLRTSRYIGVVAAYNPSTKNKWSYKGKVEGLILDKFGRTGGFGYDRIFKIALMDKYYSELSEEELFRIGHRGRGIKELLLNINFLIST